MWERTESFDCSKAVVSNLRIWPILPASFTTPHPTKYYKTRQTNFSNISRRGSECHLNKIRYSRIQERPASRVDRIRINDFGIVWRDREYWHALGQNWVKAGYTWWLWHRCLCHPQRKTREQDSKTRISCSRRLLNIRTEEEWPVRFVWMREDVQRVVHEHVVKTWQSRPENWISTEKRET